MVLTILGFRISIECVEFATAINIGIRYLLSQAFSTNTVVDRPFFHNGVLFCGDAISLQVVSEASKTRGHLELCLSSGRDVTSEYLCVSSSMHPRAPPAWRRELFELQRHLPLKFWTSWLLWHSPSCCLSCSTSSCWLWPYWLSFMSLVSEAGYLVLSFLHCSPAPWRCPLQGTPQYHHSGLVAQFWPFYLCFCSLWTSFWWAHSWWTW